MPEPELLLHFVRPLNRAGIRYVVGGSIAAIFYGEPRLTHDVDFIVFLNANDIRKLIEVFPVSDFYLPPLETMVTESAREQNGHFNLIHRATGFKADMYPTGRDELNAFAFRSKRAFKFDGETVIFASPEYVIVRKLEYFQEGRAEKHLRDIRGILSVSTGQLDQMVLNEWIERRNLTAVWRQVLT